MMKKLTQWFLDDVNEEYEENAESIDKQEVNQQMKKAKKAGNISSIVTKRPNSYTEIYETADYLKRNYPVILDLNRNSPEIINNIMDFLGGVVYAIDGIIVEASTNTYLFLPHGISIESEEDNSVSYLFNDNKEIHEEPKKTFNKNVAQPARPTGSVKNDFKPTKDIVKLQ